MTIEWSALRVAVAHEWVSARAGSEKTFEALAEAFPSADLFALTVNPDIHLEVGERQIETSFLDSVSLVRERRAWTLPIMPLAWRAMGRGRDYDLVISSSHACAKGFWPGRSTKHLTYIHAPIRYAWSPEIDGRGSSPLLTPARLALKRWDRHSVGWVDSIAANSSEIADRVRTFYGVDARVIFPPVDSQFYGATPLVPTNSRDGLAAVGRLIPYKRFDLAIRAAAALRTRLTIAGRGPGEGALRRLADELDADVRFVRPSDEELRTIYATSEALLFPGVEDFGIIPVEAQAAGTPVVASGAGGALDTVRHGETGFHVEPESAEGLVAGVEWLRRNKYSPSACREWSEQFSRERFVERVRAWAASELGDI